MTTPLTPETAIAYVRNVESLASVFGAEATLHSTPIAEGNVNLLFRVYNVRDPVNRTVLVKQALPYAWRYPSFKLPVDRARIEYEMLQLAARACPGMVPQVYHYDPVRHIQVIEDLNQHVVLRAGLMQQQHYPLVAHHMGVFMARMLFYTSDLYLASADKQALLPRFNNVVMRKVQEDLVFTQPYMPHPNNRWTPLLEPQVTQIYVDDELHAAICTLKAAYLTHAQALLHNDLHTGSIMLTLEETRVIDPEFACFGPIGHDVGTYLANLLISYAAQEYHAPDVETQFTYRAWLLDTIRETWHVFTAEFSRLWEDEGNGEWVSPRFRQQYIRQILQDTAGFAAAEIFRRTIGMAHVEDFQHIVDTQTRAVAESLALTIARAWLLNRHILTTIEELLELVVVAARPGHDYYGKR